MSTYYMHTIDGRPACMDRDGSQIVYANGLFKARLCKSLKQIRVEQRRTRSYRISQGFHDRSVYGHVLVELPR